MCIREKKTFHRRNGRNSNKEESKEFHVRRGEIVHRKAVGGSLWKKSEFHVYTFERRVKKVRVTKKGGTRGKKYTQR